MLVLQQQLVLCRDVSVCCRQEWLQMEQWAGMQGSSESCMKRYTQLV
jgi:hypothetical protein